MTIEQDEHQQRLRTAAAGPWRPPTAAQLACSHRWVVVDGVAGARELVCERCYVSTRADRSAMRGNVDPGAEHVMLRAAVEARWPSAGETAPELHGAVCSCSWSITNADPARVDHGIKGHEAATGGLNLTP